MAPDDGVAVQAERVVEEVTTLEDRFTSASSSEALSKSRGYVRGNSRGSHDVRVAEAPKYSSSATRAID